MIVKVVREDLNNGIVFNPELIRVDQVISLIKDQCYSFVTIYV